MLLFFVVVSGVERAKELSFEGKKIARVRKSKTFSSSSPPQQKKTRTSWPSLRPCAVVPHDPCK